eukprot:TRINITY_DN21191_c0_g1_i1.p1 TRINITY_DN21191_c0_g1~~TRINITY_DN21191_c0_g1_i1.p1  ORF type:complete len:407 (+),score=23.37 TRINITY_DN21191_c0_g1_i1:75-1295(+)
MHLSGNGSRDWLQWSHDVIVQDAMPVLALPGWEYILLGLVCISGALVVACSIRYEFPLFTACLPVFDVVLDYNNIFIYFSHRQFAFASAVVASVVCSALWQAVVVPREHTGFFFSEDWGIFLCKLAGFGVVVAAYETWNEEANHDSHYKLAVSKLTEAAFEGPIPTVVALYSILIADFVAGYPELTLMNLLSKYATAGLSVISGASALLHYMGRRPKHADFDKLSHTKIALIYAAELCANMAGFVIFALITKPYGVFVYGLGVWAFFAVNLFWNLDVMHKTEGFAYHVLFACVLSFAFVLGCNPFLFDSAESDYESLTRHWGIIRLSCLAVMLTGSAVRLWLDEDWHQSISQQLLRMECLPILVVAGFSTVVYFVCLGAWWPRAYTFRCTRSVSPSGQTYACIAET